MLIIIIVVVLLVLAGLTLNLFLYKRNGLQKERESPTAKLQDLLFRRNKDTASPDLSEQEWKTSEAED